MNRAKGFTIVELAIVLVVIGIILSMAVKGKSLVDAARMRAEVAKLNKFEAAAAIWFAKTGRFPDLQTVPLNWREPNVRQEDFIEAEILTTADFKSALPSRTNGNKVWAIWLCAKAGSDASGATYHPYEMTLPGGALHPRPPKLCAGTHNVKDMTLYMDYRLVCNIELMKDDQNYQTGDGLTVNVDYAFVTSVPPDFKDCNAWAERVYKSTSYEIMYWYGIL